MRVLALTLILVARSTSVTFAKVDCERSYNVCINRCLKVAQGAKPACISACNDKQKSCGAPQRKH
jgi:hypothetical protein